MTLYLVKRTSNCGGNESPCDGAIPIVRQDWEYSACKTGERYRELHKKDWSNIGTEHGKWEGGICRRLEDTKCWAIELDNLHGFVKEHGPIILSVQDEIDHGPNEEAMFQIEIYDDYRE